MSEATGYPTYVKTIVSANGEIALPPELQRLDHVEPGQEFDVERLDRGEYRLVRISSRPNEGAIDWLLACPHKGFFASIDSEPISSI